MPKAKTETAAPKATRRAKRSVENAPTPPRETHTAKGGYKVKAALSVPMVKFNPGDSYAFQIESVRTMGLGGATVKTKAVVLRGTDLDTGEIKDFISNTVLTSTLVRAYGPLPAYDESKDTPPDHFESTGWEGKAILVECSKRDGRRYADMAVMEVEV